MSGKRPGSGEGSLTPMGTHTQGPAAALAAPTVSARPRIALVIDQPEWAFGRVARQIVMHLGDRYDFDVLRMDDIEDATLFLLDAAEYDLVHAFWRGWLALAVKEYLRTAGCHQTLPPAHSIRHAFRLSRITTSIYDHLYLTPPEIRANCILFNELLSGYTVSSKKLERIYREITEYPDPDAVTEDGVDLSFFAPHQLHRLGDDRRAVVVGWVGNSEWGMEHSSFDHKGVKTILLPAIEELNASGVRTFVRLADLRTSRLPFSRMPDYFLSIDILVCVSASEGTPNPVLEAMACGVPVISTDVGVVSELFGPEQSRFLLRERSKDALVEKLRELIKSPGRRMQLSAENLERIQHWSWAYQVRKFDDFFRRILAREPRGNENERGAEVGRPEAYCRYKDGRMKQLQQDILELRSKLDELQTWTNELQRAKDWLDGEYKRLKLLDERQGVPYRVGIRPAVGRLLRTLSRSPRDLCRAVRERTLKKRSGRETP